MDKNKDDDDAVFNNVFNIDHLDVHADVLNADINDVLNDLENHTNTEATEIMEIEAAKSGIYPYESIHEILNLFGLIVHRVLKGSKEISNKRVLYSLLASYSHYMIPLLHKALNSLFNYLILKNMNQAVLINNVDFIEELQEKLITFSRRLIHYHKVSNELKRIDGVPKCGCVFLLIAHDYPLLKDQDWWKDIKQNRK